MRVCSNRALGSLVRSNSLITGAMEPGDDPSLANILTDKYGRKHTYLRISLTERCNLRCKKMLYILYII